MIFFRGAKIKKIHREISIAKKFVTFGLDEKEKKKLRLEPKQCLEKITNVGKKKCDEKINTKHI